MQGIDPDRHDAARLDAVTTDGDVTHSQASDTRGGRLQSERLAQDLDGVSEPGRVVGCQIPIADRGSLRGDAILYVAMVPQRPERVRERRRGRIVPRQHE